MRPLQGLALATQFMPHMWGRSSPCVASEVNVPLAAHLYAVVTVVRNELRPLGLEIAREAR